MSLTENKDINEILKTAASDGSISCPDAFKIVREHNVFPDILGVALNSNKIKIKECQLGLFGHNGTKKVRPAETVSEELEDRIFDFLDDNRLACAAAWNIASEMKMSKFDVACACEKIKIKVCKCQLGAF